MGTPTTTDTDVDQLTATLQYLPKLLREREKALDERERQLEHVRVLLEEKHPCSGEPSDVLTLNVGGTIISVLRRTLTQVEGSMLASRFSGRWDKSLEKDKDDRFFIDQDPDLFTVLLSHLRDRANQTQGGAALRPKFALEDWHRKIAFDRMLDYYGLTLGVYPVGLYALGKEGRGALISGDPGYEVTNGEMSYALAPLENTRPKGFCSVRQPQAIEVTLEEFTSAQVGWYIDEKETSFFDSMKPGETGVGYGQYSYAIDCAKNGMVGWNGLERHFRSLSGARSTTGTVIRTEWAYATGANVDMKWFVDGELVASSHGPSVDGIVETPKLATRNPVACISINGSFRVTAIELERTTVPL